MRIVQKNRISHCFGIDFEKPRKLKRGRNSENPGNVGRIWKIVRNHLIVFLIL